MLRKKPPENFKRKEMPSDSKDPRKLMMPITRSRTLTKKSRRLKRNSKTPTREWKHKSSTELNTWLLTLKSKVFQLRSSSGVWKSSKPMLVSTVSIRPKLSMKLRSRKKTASNVSKKTHSGKLTMMQPERTMRTSKGNSMRSKETFTRLRTNSTGWREKNVSNNNKGLMSSEEKCRNSKSRLINTDKLGRDSNKRPKIKPGRKKEEERKKLRDSSKTTREPSKNMRVPEIDTKRNSDTSSGSKHIIVLNLKIIGKPRNGSPKLKMK